MPKPSTVRNMPSSRFSSIRRTSSRVARHADVEVAVGGEDDAVVAARRLKFARAPLRRRAGCPAPPAVEPPASQPLDRLQDRRLLVARRGRQHEPRRAGVDHDRDAVLRAQLVHEQAERLLHQRQLVGGCIEPDDVDQEHEVARRQLAAVDRAAPGARSRTSRCSGCHGRRADLGRRRRTGARRAAPRVVVGEVVHQLLDAHRVARAGAARRVRKRRTLLYDARSTSTEKVERGSRGDGEERVVVDLLVLLAVGRFLLNAIFANPRPRHVHRGGAWTSWPMDSMTRGPVGPGSGGAEPEQRVVSSPGRSAPRAGRVGARRDASCGASRGILCPFAAVGRRNTVPWDAAGT